MNGLPGIEVVFREHKRLAYKLTKDEMKAIQNYIEDRVLQEQNDILFKTNFMQSEYEANIRQMREKVNILEKELDFKSQLLNQYRMSDNNLASVHKQRGERLEQRQSQLLTDLELNQDTIKELKIKTERLIYETQEKEKIISDQSRHVEKLKERLEQYQENETALFQNEQLTQEMLRVKLEMDSKDRAITKLQQEKLNVQREKAEFEKKVKDAEKRLESMRLELERQISTSSTKQENLLRLQLQLENERKNNRHGEPILNGTTNNNYLKNGVAENRQVRFQNGSPADTPRNVVQNGYQGIHKAVTEKREDNQEELLRERNEALRKELLLIESRVKLLEEKISIYRNQSRDMNEESGEISENANTVAQLYEKIYVHGNTIVEKLLQDLQESINGRKVKIETSINDLLKQAPGVVSRDVCDIRADVISLKKQAEHAKVNDVFVRSSRLLARLEACEKTKFSARFFGESKYQNLKKAGTKTEDLRGDKVFSVRKPQNIPALSRPKQINMSSQNAWKRKHSLSMDPGSCLSPTLIDLSLASPTSPTPRDNKTKGYFGFTQNEKGIERKSFSEPNFRMDY